MKYVITPEAQRLVDDRSRVFEHHVGNLSEQLAVDHPIAGQIVVQKKHMQEACEKLVGCVDQMRTCFSGIEPEIGDIPHIPVDSNAMDLLYVRTIDRLQHWMNACAALMAMAEELPPDGTKPVVHVRLIQGLLAELSSMTEVPARLVGILKGEDPRYDREPEKDRDDEEV